MTDPQPAWSGLDRLDAKVLWRLVFESSQHAMAISRVLDGTIVAANPAMASLLGRPAADLVGARFADFVAADFPDERRQQVARQLEADGGIVNVPVTALRPSGEAIHGLFSAQVLEVDGEALMLSASLGTSAGGRGESALSDSDRLSIQLLEGLPLQLLVVGTTSPAVYANSRFLEFYGITEFRSFEEILGHMHPDDIPLVLDAQRRLRGGEPSVRVEFRAFDAGGSLHWLLGLSLARRFADGAAVGHVFAFLDITERKSAESAVQASEERYRALVNNMVDLVYTASADNRLTFVSPTARRYGYDPDAVLGCDFMSFIAPEDRPRVAAAISRSQETGEPFCETYRLALANGSRWVEGRGQAQHDAEGRPCGLSGVLRDVTGQVADAEQIRRQAALLELGRDAMLVWEPSAGIRYMNRAAEALTGMARAAAEGLPLEEVLRPQSPLHIEVAMTSVAKTGGWSGELQLHGLGGREHVVDSQWTPINHDGVPGAVLIRCTDISERKQLHEQYLRAQRLESLGTLAGGVAHDLNNILSPIVMGLDVLEDTPLEPEVRSVVMMMRESARRGSDTVRQLLTFGRGTDTQKGPVQPRHLLKEIERLVRRTFPKNVQIYADYAGAPWPVIADPSQLHQVLVNLCVNARDAMPGGGLLFIGLENCELDEIGARVHPAATPGRYVVIRVSDSGTGMANDVREHIFDPFFTTKPPGSGTGLGLATVLGIVSSHDGFVLVESEVGRGSTFKIYLPAAAGSAVSADSRPTASLPAGTGELVLVVDDESTVRLMTEALLRRHGYRVIAASSPSEALELLSSAELDVRVVLTDIMMPGGDGLDLIRKVVARRPAPAVVAMSGLATVSSKAEALKLGARGLIGKPFSAEQLLLVLRSALAEERVKVAE
jgi:PAS domain S-box-containing protein